MSLWGKEEVPLEMPSVAERIRNRLVELEAFGRYTSITDAQWTRLYEYVGNFDVVIDALLMRPWPAWLRGVLFPGRTSRP